MFYIWPWRILQPSDIIAFAKSGRGVCFIMINEEPSIRSYIRELGKRMISRG
jgi:hypothetical protein